MALIQLPLAITYDTRGNTPIRDVIAALNAADIAVQDAVSLLPSLFDGMSIQKSEVLVRSLTQESPLRELFLVALFVSFQDNLEREVPAVLEDILKVNIPDSYDSIVTLLTLIVVFYGAALLKDAATKAFEDGPLHSQLDSAIRQLSSAIGRSESEIRDILDAKYGKPTPIKRLARAVRGFFLPSRNEGASKVIFDREVVEKEVIAETTFVESFDENQDFERYDSHSDVVLEIHAQDRDKSNTGWAAVPLGLHNARLKMKLIEPVQSENIWNQNSIRGDITLVSKLTADGYVPSEIHLRRIVPNSLVH